MISVWLASLWSRVSGWVIAAGAVMAALGAAFLAGKREGRQTAQADTTQATADALRRADEGGAQYRADGGAQARLQKGDF